MRKIIHVDMDAFYASVEQRDHPELRGKPVAVGHSARRGVVVAASYEARKFGVHSAMPSVTAIEKCPDLIFVSTRFDVYRAASQQIREIFHSFTPLVEPLSLDEAYLDVTDQLGDKTATVTAAEIRQKILEATGLTASAGISYNKFLAKLASEQRKPNGQFVIPPEKGPHFIEILPVGKFHGIGAVTATKMCQLGIQTGADLRACTLQFLVSHFGKVGSWYYAIARGEDDRQVQPNRKRKSSGSENTFSSDLTDLASIKRGTKEMVDDVWAWCANHQSYGRTVTVKIKYADFKQITRSQSFTSPIDSHEKLVKASDQLIKTIFPLRLGVRLIGVSVSNFGTRLETETNQLGFNFNRAQKM